MTEKKIAIVADWLTSRGGAENVILAMLKAFPKADLYTSVYNPKLFPELGDKDVHTTYLQKLPRKIREKHQFLLPLFPKAFEKLDLSNYDIILSSASSGFSKCVKKSRPEQIHICYCHTPVRFLYHAREEYLQDYPLPWFGKPLKPALPKLLDSLTKKDQEAAQKVDHFIANSDFVGQRIKKYYNKESKTIHPCIDTKPFVDKTPVQGHLNPGSEEGKYFFALGRFIPYKKFDLLVETFAQNKLPLKLGGIGPELEKCKKLAETLDAKNIQFLGFVERSDLPKLYSNARAFLFPAEEDFGLTPVEAMCTGRPVIYLNQGGAKESVGEGCGISFSQQSVKSLQKAIDEFIEKEKLFNSEKIQEQGRRFDEKVFGENLKHFIKSVL